MLNQFNNLISNLSRLVITYLGFERVIKVILAQINLWVHVGCTNHYDYVFYTQDFFFLAENILHLDIFVCIWTFYVQLKSA